MHPSLGQGQHLTQTGHRGDHRGDHRFSLQVSNAQPVIFQSDRERSTRQILRATEHARAGVGLSSEIRAETTRTVQSVRKLANTLRTYAEEQSGVKVHSTPIHGHSGMQHESSMVLLHLRP